VSAQLLLQIFLSDILPIFIVAGTGFVLARRVAVKAGVPAAPAGAVGWSVRVLSSVSFNALAPCLVFTLMVSSSISALDFGRMALFCVLVMAIRGILARLLAVPLGLDRVTRAGFLLVVVFSNSGNFGLPVVLFAFGREALAFATVYFVIAAVLSYTVGVFLAASGRRSFMEALRGITRVPTVYAVIAAAIVLALEVPIPIGVMRAITLMSDASLPMLMLVLGMQLQSARRADHPAAVAVAAALSLVVSPLLAFPLASAVGLTGPAFEAGVLQAAMPAAIVTTILAIEFDLDPTFPTSVVFVSTLLSPFTVTLLIAFLRGA
jgi:malate permease and related proteins